MKAFAAGAVTALLATATVVIVGGRWLQHRLELNGC